MLKSVFKKEPLLRKKGTRIPKDFQTLSGTKVRGNNSNWVPKRFHMNIVPEANVSFGANVPCPANNKASSLSWVPKTK